VSNAQGSKGKETGEGWEVVCVRDIELGGTHPAKG